MSTKLPRMQSHRRLERTTGTVLQFVLYALFVSAATAYAQSPDTATLEQKTGEQDYKLAELIVSIFGFSGTVALLLIGLRQYRRADLWKRSEFIAKEIEAFQKDPAVRNVFAMLDWDSRHINLYLRSEPKAADMVFVDRELLWKALLPHPVKYKREEYRIPDETDRSNADHQQSALPAKDQIFRLSETAIRDTFDVFLSYLQQFSHFIKTELVTSEEIGGYLTYWVKQIADPDENKGNRDSRWRLVLLAYINFYGFEIRTLFEGLGYYIGPKECCYKSVEQKLGKDHSQLVCDLRSLFNKENVCCNHR